MIDFDQTHVELPIEEILYEYCNLLYLLYVTHFDVNMTHLMYQILTQKYRYTKGEKRYSSSSTYAYGENNIDGIL